MFFQNYFCLLFLGPQRLQKLKPPCTSSSALKIIWIIFSEKHYLLGNHLSEMLNFLDDVGKCKVSLKNNSNNFSENLFTTFLAHFDGKSKFIWIIFLKNHYSVTGFLKHLSFFHDVEKFKVSLKNNRNIFSQKYVHNFSEQGHILKPSFHNLDSPNLLFLWRIYFKANL